MARSRDLSAVVIYTGHSMELYSIRSTNDELPTLPAPDFRGNVPAVEYGRKLLARRLVLARRRAGLTQAELARRAKIRVETLNRLEKGRHNPDETTFNKIEAALRAQGVQI